MESDVRWMQRHKSFSAALNQLRAAVQLAAERPLSDLERQGLIQSFEFTHELAWNLLKDILQWQGFTGLLGSRDATRTAFSTGLIDDGAVWMEMITSRNQTTHTYHETTARGIAEQVRRSYLAAFDSLLLRIETELDDLLLPYSIDLSLFHYVENADLIAQIERVGVTIYARSDRFPLRRKALSGNQG